MRFRIPLPDLPKSLPPAVSYDKVASPLAVSTRIEGNYQQEQAVKSIKRKIRRLMQLLVTATPFLLIVQLVCASESRPWEGWVGETTHNRCTKCGNVTISPENHRFEGSCRLECHTSMLCKWFPALRRNTVAFVFKYRTLENEENSVLSTGNHLHRDPVPHIRTRVRNTGSFRCKNTKLARQNWEGGESKEIHD